MNSSTCTGCCLGVNMLNLKKVLICLLLLLTLCSAFGATKERRIALVIGNSEYKSTPLRNPVNDAKAMEITLKELGFETTAAYNVTTYQEFGKLIQDFGTEISQGGVGLFYYAGHGVQVDGKNYLIPTHARIKKESDIEFEGVDLDRVLSEMQNARNELNIIVLDACRDNPFSSSVRSGTRGLASITRTVPDCLIAYATQPNGVAADGDGVNGIFTEELLKSITTPGLSLTQIMMRVRDGVKNRTDNEQLPWETSLLTKDFYFLPDASALNRERLNSELEMNLGIQVGTSYQTQKWFAFSLSALSVLSSIYFNGRSDYYYDKYKSADSAGNATMYRDKTENYDTYKTISTYTIPIPVGWFIYAMIKDSGKRGK
jgi:hypothetical protein